MKILAVSQYYWPEPFNVSEICEELVKRGNEVTVLTGVPNYPEGTVYPGYKARTPLDEVRNGVFVKRVANRERKTGSVNRFLNYFSFSHEGAKAAGMFDSDYDVVLSFEISPVMSAKPAIKYAQIHDAPLLIYVIDIWPECLCAGGIKKDSTIYKLFARVSRKIYESADSLAITSLDFEKYLSGLLGKEIHCCYLPQYAEEMFEDLPADSEGLASDLFPNDRVNVMFAGNIGTAQSVQTLVKAADLLKDEPFRFHIVGSGSELDNCKALAKELDLDNIVFHGRHPLEEMPAYYAKADAMVATFANDPVLGYTLPRKIQSYMAAGKPVIGTVTGEAKRVLEEAQCGFCCEAEDFEGLADCLRQFAKLSDQKRKELGANARAYCEKHYSRERFFDVLIGELEKLKGTKHGR